MSISQPLLKGKTRFIKLKKREIVKWMNALKISSMSISAGGRKKLKKETDVLEWSPNRKISADGGLFRSICRRVLAASCC
jgi:hypothetical protein